MRRIIIKCDVCGIECDYDTRQRDRPERERWHKVALCIDDAHAWTGDACSQRCVDAALQRLTSCTEIPS